MTITRVLETRPHYYYGQLLLAEDFLAEQSYHAKARRHHNLRLHGWGVVTGLEVERAGKSSVRLRPGFAIDREGRDVFLEEPELFDLGQFGAGVVVTLELAYEEQGADDANTHQCLAVLRAVEQGQAGTGIHLASVHLDDQGEVPEHAVSYEATHFARPRLGRGSVNAEALAPSLRRGWVRMPFRPIPLTNVPAGEQAIPPAFRVGATEALSPRPTGEGAEDHGAAGTMELVIPPSSRQVTGFRIAGERNEGEITFHLVVAGWDPDTNQHARRELLSEMIPPGSPYRRDYPLDGAPLDPGFSTLSLWLRASRRASVSLVAVELEY